MYNKSTILSNFAELVGYREENEQTLTASQKASDSDLFVNDLAGVTLDAIAKSAYLKSDLTPEQTVSEYLSKIYDTAVLRTIDDFLRKTQTYLKEKPIKKIKWANNFNDTELLEEENGRFVGYAFQLKNGYNLICELQKISLQLVEAQSVKIYLYDLLKNEAITTFDFDFTTPKSVQSKTLTDFLLKYQDAESSEKQYLIGYYEYDSANPLPEHQLNSTNQAYNTEISEIHDDALFFCPVTIDNQFLNYNSGSGLYDLPTEVSDNLSSDLNTPLSFFVNVECDYTDILIENKLEFAETLQYQLAKRIITDCLYTNEFNTITEQNRKRWESLLLYFNNQLNGYKFTDQYGNDAYSWGLTKKLVKTFEGIDKNCFPRLRSMDI